MKRFLHSSRLPLKPVVDLTFYHQPAPDMIAGVKNVRPAVINIHGLFGSNRLFRPFNKPLAQALKTDIFSIDLRNHGNSPFALPYDYVTCTKDVVQFIKNHIGIERPVQVVGFSLGGKVALLASLCSEINVSKCISIDLPPYETPTLDPVTIENYDLITRILKREIKIEKGSKNWKNKVLQLFQGLPANAENKGDPSLYFANGFYSVRENSKPPTLDQHDPYIDYYLPLDEFPDLISEIKKWPDLLGEDNAEGLFKYSTDIPVLLMKGRTSNFIKDDPSPLKKSFPNSKIKVFDSGHNLTVEKPEETLQCMIDFLKID